MLTVADSDSHNPTTDNAPVGEPRKVVKLPPSPPTEAEHRSHSLNVPDWREAIEQIRRTQKTQNFLNHLADCSLADLNKVLLRLTADSEATIRAAEAHNWSIIVQDGACAGLVTQRLAQRPGASRFFQGGITVCNGEALLRYVPGASDKVEFYARDVAKGLNFFTRRFADINRLPSNLILNANGSLHEGKVTVSMGMAGKKPSIGTFSLPVSQQCKAANQSWQASQVLAAIASIHTMTSWLEDTLRGQASTLELTPRPIGPAPALLHFTSASAAHDVARLTLAASRLVDVLSEVRLFFQKIDITLGESFTGGAINSAIQSRPGQADMIAAAFVFYSKSFKAAFNIDQSHLNYDNIATPRTAHMAAVGLLDNPPAVSGPRTFIAGAATTLHCALATTGWVNRAAGGDEFSVSAVIRQGENEKNRTITMKLPNANKLPVSYDRSRITIQSGVVMGMYCLISSIMDHHSLLKQKFGQKLKNARLLVENVAGSTTQFVNI